MTFGEKMTVANNNFNGSYTWTVIGGTVIGASHKSKQLPNQDDCLVAIAHITQSCEQLNITPQTSQKSEDDPCRKLALSTTEFTNDGDQPFIIAVVCDGHGSGKAFRSHIGAHIATQVAISSTQTFIQQLIDSDCSQEDIKIKAQLYLPQQLVSLWQDSIHQHYQQNPLTADEIAHYQRAYAKTYQDSTNQTLEYLYFYGTTLCLALVTTKYILYINIGDADIIEVYEHPTETHTKSPFNNTSLGDDVYSLCLDNAAELFDIYFQPLDEEHNLPPSLIMMTTDGYGNSYRNDHDFQQTALDYCSLLTTQGAQAVDAALIGWLEETTQQGSGDDISIILLKTQQCQMRSESADPNQRCTD